MKQIKTFSNSFVLQETDENGRVIFQMGYPKGGLNYLIKNGSIKFFLTEDYFYKNVVWGANIPLVVDGVSYGETALPVALKKIFENVNGSGETITVDTELDEESLNPIANSPVALKFDEIEAEMADIQSGMVETSAFTAFSASVETELDNKLDASAYTPTDLSNYYTKDETSGATQISEALSGKASQSDLLTVSGQVANKQDTLIAGENITISGNVISATGGGGQITVDSQLSPTSENPVQNKVLYDQLVVSEGEGYSYLKDIVSAHTANTAIHVTAEDKTTWNNKSDFSGSYNDLTDKPTIPTSASQLTNDAGYITSGDVQSQIDSSISGKVNTSDFNSYSATVETELGNKLDASAYTPTDLSNYYTKQETDDEIDEAVSGKTNESAFTSHTGDSSIHLTTGDVQSQIDSSISGKTNQSDFSAHTANTDIHVTTAQTASWDAKSDFSGSYNDLTDKPTIPTVPTSNTAFTNDAGYITSGDAQSQIDSSISGKVNTSDFNSYSATVETELGNKLDSSAYTPTDLSNYYTKSETNDEITAAVSGKADSSTVSALNDVVTAHTANTDIHVTTADKTAWNAKSDFSGSYNDLTDKPTIPTSASQLTNDAGYITEDAISGKVDTSAFTSYSASVETELGNKLDASAYTPTDLSQYWTSAQTDSAITAAVSGKQDTLSAGTGIDITNNVISATGGSGGGNPTVELTQAEYDALVSAGTVSANTYYIITDAYSPDLSAVTSSVTSASTDSEIPTAKAVYDALGSASGGITSGEVQTLIDESISGKADSSAVTAVNNVLTAHTADSTIHVTSSDKSTWSGKQDALVSGTNIKTINNESILGSGNITIQGGGGTVDQSIISGSTNAVAGGAVFNATYVESGYTGWENVDFDGTMATDINSAQIKITMPPPSTDGMTLTVNCVDGQMIMFTYSENDGNWSYEDSEEVISEFSYEDPEFNLTVIEGVLIEMLSFDEPVEATVEKYAEDYSATPLKTVVQNLENAVVSAVSSVNSCLTGGSFNLSNQHIIQLAFYDNAGTQPQTNIPLADDLKVANSALTTDIKVPLGSGWTAVTIVDDSTKETEEINASQVKVVLTGTPSQDNVIWVQDGEDNWEAIMYDDDAWRNDTSFISGITASGNDLYLTASEGSTIKKLAADENPELIDSVQKFVVQTQDLIPYVQETKSDLGGLKLQQITQSAYDALVSGGTVDNSTIYYIVN